MKCRVLSNTPSQGLQDSTAQVRVAQSLELLLDLGKVQREVKVILRLHLLNESGTPEIYTIMSHEFKQTHLQYGL